MLSLFRTFKNKFFKKSPALPMYLIVGEEKGTYLLVKNFYDVMENDEQAKECLLTHELVDGKIPDEIKKKLFMFLCGWFGGPNLFVETFGPPRMRARHMHVTITEKEKEQWLYCMDKSLKMHIPLLNKSQYKTMINSFTALAMRIQNK
jgi:hemoglobin